MQLLDGGQNCPRLKETTESVKEGERDQCREGRRVSVVCGGEGGGRGGSERRGQVGKF